MQALITQQNNTYDKDNNLIMVNLQLQTNVNNKTNTLSYDLTAQEVSSVISDDSGATLQSIAAAQAQIVVNAVKQADNNQTITTDNSRIDISNLVAFFIFGLLAAGILISGISLVHSIKASKRVKCSDFKTQPDAQVAYNNGAKYLDGNHDGIACNDLPK